MSMLDVLKSRLPDGLTIVSVKDRSNASQMRITFAYEGEESVNWLSKTCVPGRENKLCDQTIACTMLGYALDRKDLQMADYWREKMLNP